MTMTFGISHCFHSDEDLTIQRVIFSGQKIYASFQI